MRVHFPSLRLIVVALSLILSYSCKKTDSSISDPPDTRQPAITPVGIPVGNPVSKNIGAAGGTLVSPDGRLELNIPIGALSSNTDISIQPVTNEAPGGIGLSYDLLPNGTTFSKPATITFRYTLEEVNDNIPYFLYIAYQDSLNRWIADKRQRDFDTVAKTVSLEINHFTIYSYGDGIEIIARPNSVHKEESSSIEITETTVSADGMLTETDYIPDKFVGPWKVNGNVNGNSADGTILGSGSVVDYLAPATINEKRKVRVSALLKIDETIFKGGKKIAEFDDFERAVDITLEPPKEYKYDIGLLVLDSTISSFYGGLKHGLPIYRDTATLHLNIKIIDKHHIEVVMSSPPENAPPLVTPPSKSFQGTDFLWLADSYGVINITEMSLTDIELPDDSVLNFSLRHSNTNNPGVFRKSSETGEVYTNAPPHPFGEGHGIPLTFEVDLKHRDSYIYKSGFFGNSVYIRIIPK